MARPLRIEFPDAIYHVTARGIERRPIVADDRDRRSWLDRVEKVVRRYRWRMFAFVLMDNHFHFFLQTPEPNLSAGMHDFIGGHATYFNARHRRSGHLFQGRFKDVLVESEGHWLELSRYIHLNPVRAGLVDRPEQWPWSSYPGYACPRRRVDWVDYFRVLGEFGGDSPAAERRYRTFVEEGLTRKLDSPLASALHGMVLGSREFFETIRARLRDHPGEPEVPLLKHARAPRLGMPQVLDAVARHFDCDPTRWQQGRRCDGLARAVAAYVARQQTALPSGAIAKSLGYRAASSVSMACRRVEASLGERELARAVRQISEELAAIDY